MRRDTDICLSQIWEVNGGTGITIVKDTVSYGGAGRAKLPFLVQ